MTESDQKTLFEKLDAYVMRKLNEEESEVDRLRAENAELRADAERYRWLRNDNKRMHYTTDFDAGGKYGKGDTVDIILIEIPCAFEEPRWTPEGHFDYALELDAAIDAARGAQPTTLAAPANEDMNISDIIREQYETRVLKQYDGGPIMADGSPADPEKFGVITINAKKNT